MILKHNEINHFFFTFSFLSLLYVKEEINKAYVYAGTNFNKDPRINGW